MLFWLKHLEATITMTPFATQTFKRADVHCVYLSDSTDNMRMFPIRMDTAHHTFAVLCWILYKYTEKMGKIIFAYIYRETAKKGNNTSDKQELKVSGAKQHTISAVAVSCTRNTSDTNIPLVLRITRNTMYELVGRQWFQLNAPHTAEPKQPTCTRLRY